MRTSVVSDFLSDPKVRVVLFTKNNERVEYYKKEFSNPRMIYEVVRHPKSDWIDKIFQKLKFVLLRTETTDLRRQMVYEERKNLLLYYGGLFLNRLLARPAVRRIVRAMDLRLVWDNTYARHFDIYKPDIIFCAHLFDEPEIHLLREARKRGIKSVGFINSWDKVTARCILRLLPDKVVVFNNIVKKEMMDYNEMKEENIFVSGLPQYDIYVNLNPGKREDFYKNLNIKPSVKRVIVYAPDGKYSAKADGAMIDLLRSFIEKSLIPEDVELLVRFQPNDIVNMEEIRKRPWLVYDIPGIRFSQERGIDWDMNARDHQQLLNTLFHSSLLICYTSSLSIDSAVFGKPVININFQLNQAEKFSQSPIRYYQMAHYKNALNTGGIRVVKSVAELLEWINFYLENSGLDKEKRERLVQEQCWKVDGKSGRRISSFVLDYLYK